MTAVRDCFAPRSTIPLLFRPAGWLIALIWHWGRGQAGPNPPLTRPSPSSPCCSTPPLPAPLGGGGQRGHSWSPTTTQELEQSRVPTRALLTAVHMLDETTGWAADTTR